MTTDEMVEKLVMEVARELHAKECACPKVPGAKPESPYKSGWTYYAIGVVASSLDGLRNRL